MDSITHTVTPLKRNADVNAREGHRTTARRQECCAEEEQALHSAMQDAFHGKGVAVERR
jgi:hypothetical protein